MTTVQRLSAQILESLDGDLWHGPSLSELLADVTPEIAAAKPLSGGHSIWEIVLHLTTWIEKATAALDGKLMPKWPFPEDWPPATGDWNTARVDLALAIRRLTTRLDKQDGTLVEAMVPGREYTFEYLLNGLALHSAYHAGQIAMLKRTSAG